MIETSILAQLKELFSTLDGEYVLALRPSANARQNELRELLEQVSSASNKIRIVEQGEQSASVQFEISKNGASTGICFRGIPGGHEFSSLVLAILNADGKGKLPDKAVQERVQALRGPITLRTYVSLSCTNCPNVVQALNQMAVIHGAFRHETVDGGVAEDEIARLGVQAVPSVFAGEKLLHVGRSSFEELLTVLENHFGRRETSDSSIGKERANVAPRHFQVVVVGGGPAGCAAAIYSARKGLSTALVTQKVGGQVLETVGIENLISTAYIEGAKLAANMEKHLRAYPVEVMDQRRVEQIRADPKPVIHLKGGEVLQADSLILATGARWRELGVPGEKEFLGRGVAFCPHCDGPFYRGKPVAVVGGGNSGVEAAIDLSGICDQVTLVEFQNELKADRVLVQKLQSLPNVKVITGARVTQIVGGVTALIYEDRATKETKQISVEGVFVQIGLVPNSELVKDLVQINAQGEIVIDDRCRTNKAGIYAAGDVTTVPFKQIVTAMGEGAKAALAAFEDRIRGRLPSA